MRDAPVWRTSSWHCARSLGPLKCNAITVGNNIKRIADPSSHSKMIGMSHVTHVAKPHALKLDIHSVTCRCEVTRNSHSVRIVLVAQPTTPSLVRETQSIATETASNVVLTDGRPFQSSTASTVASWNICTRSLRSSRWHPVDRSPCRD